jgi:ABC-type nitrate/sulfonate/bicarbonate transport system permease component
MKSGVRSRVVAALLPWLTPVFLLLVWQGSAWLGWLPRKVLPAPLDVIRAGKELMASGELARHLGISALRVSIGFVIGGSLGFVLGLCTGSSRHGELLLDTSIQMLRTVPHLALVPLVIIWFGIGETAKVFLVALGVLFPIYLNTYHGIRTLDPGLIELGRIHGLNRRQMFLQIVLPGALPSVLVGVRYALGVAWLTLIVAETVSSASGVGYLAMNAREFLRTDVVVLSILLYASMGKAADGAARQLERYWLRWHPSYQIGSDLAR